MCIDTDATAQNIVQMQQTTGITCKDMMNACGVTAAAVTKWRRGVNVPSIDNMVILAEMFHTTIDAIVVTK